MDDLCSKGGFVLWLTLIAAVLIMGAAVMLVEWIFHLLGKAARNLFGV